MHKTVLKNLEKHQIRVDTMLRYLQNCIPHDSITAKLHAYGFDMSSLKLMNSYLMNRHERVKINNSCSLWKKLIKYDVPQRSILRPVLFDIFLCDLLFIIDNVDVASYADDNTPYTHGKHQIRFSKHLNVHPEMYLNGSLIMQ